MAINPAGPGEPSRIVTATPFDHPGAPTELAVIAGDSEAVLSWRPPVYDGSSAITGYIVFRGATLDALQPIEGTVGGQTLTDDALTNGDRYFYAVAAVNMAGRSPMAEVVSVTPMEALTAPGTVRALVAQAKGARVSLAWSPPEEDGGNPVTGYVVMRGTTSDALNILAIGSSTTAFNKTTVERGRTYYYAVKAKSTIGEGEPTASVEVTVPGASEDGPGFTAVSVMVGAMAIALAFRRMRRT